MIAEKGGKSCEITSLNKHTSLNVYNITSNGNPQNLRQMLTSIKLFLLPRV